MEHKYCNSLTEYSRFRTREVKIGGIGIGGPNPIRIQSMTNTPTMDTEATAAQVLRMVDAGCELVRITAPGVKDAENLENIKKTVRASGSDVPLVADIHFVPQAAEVAARIVEKVRINPGNYASKNKPGKIDFTDQEFQEEYEKIAENLFPLLKVCKEYGTAIRIGTNHGSLAQRMMSKYGDTPLGMVESALEFARICRDQNFNNIVFSMKSSNIRVMTQAYRLLVNKMMEEAMDYPLHLGVTEAGDGDDARIKSAAGIGSLLEDGIGDTVRVSLTEAPEAEAPVARKIINRYSHRAGHKEIIPVDFLIKDPFEYSKRESYEVAGIGGDNPPVVVSEFCDCSSVSAKDFAGSGHNFDENSLTWKCSDMSADFICVGENDVNFDFGNDVKLLTDAGKWDGRKNVYPVFTMDEYFSSGKKSDEANFVIVKIDALKDKRFEKLINEPGLVFVLQTDNKHGMAEQRRFFFELMYRKINNPVIISRNFEDMEREEFVINSAADIAPLLLEGFGDGVIAKSENLKLSGSEPKSELVNKTIFGILQASRVRISKTEFISCPSCGRTQFDLVEVVAKVRSKTSHLTGLKIAVMGCIVNGPGEMADADYGYVGAGKGKVTLYRAKEVVKRGVNEDIAVDELIGIIKGDGKWMEPQVQ